MARGVATVLGLTLTVLPPAAQACDVALLLAIDVSNSIDAAEYRLQTDGLADALLDPEIAEALLQAEAALAVVQWSGVDRQVLVQDWARMRSLTDIRVFADLARGSERAFVLSDTAPAEALMFSLDQFTAVQDCKRRIIDVSGDGTANAGADVRGLGREAERRGVTINGLAIESMGRAITTYFERAIITSDGFVMTARGHREYPQTIRRKILREVSATLF